MWPWWLNIPTEDFTDKTLAIDDTQRDDVRCGDWGAGHGGWQVGRWGDWHLTLRTDLTDETLEWKYLLKALLMRLWRLMILLEMMLEVVIGVMVMEVDKVADEVTDMEIDK